MATLLFMFLSSVKIVCKRKLLPVPEEKHQIEVNSDFKSVPALPVKKMLLPLRH